MLVSTPDTAKVRFIEVEKETTKFGVLSRPAPILLLRVATEMTVSMVHMVPKTTTKKFLGKEEKTS